jgi:uncharacterized integral membrane protein
MKENNKKEILDDKQWIKSMMESSRKEPPENLSYRIMHQIETEQALTRAKPKEKKQSTTSPLKDLWIFGAMYFVLFITGGYFYMQGGKDALLTDAFLWTCIMIGSIFSLLFLITAIDNTRRSKAKNKSVASE